jgi:hypothetical protein
MAYRIGISLFVLHSDMLPRKRHRRQQQWRCEGATKEKRTWGRWEAMA